jgi:hypothetical protein
MASRAGWFGENTWAWSLSVRFIVSARTQFKEEEAAWSSSSSSSLTLPRQGEKDARDRVDVLVARGQGGRHDLGFVSSVSVGKSDLLRTSNLVQHSESMSTSKDEESLTTALMTLGNTLTPTC